MNQEQHWKGNTKSEHFSPCTLEIARSFFCAAKMDEHGFLFIGGFGSDKSVLKDVRFRNNFLIKI